MSPYSSTPLRTNALTGAETIVAGLKRHGVTTVFSLAGSANTYLLDAVERAGMSIVGGRHETAVIGAAEGYARTTGGLGVACINEDQGVPSAISGIANAAHALTPLVVIVCRLPGRWHDAQSRYDHDTQSMFAGLAKWHRVVPAAERLAEFVDAACREAASGRTGPVVLTIPRDFYRDQVPFDAVSNAPLAGRSLPQPDPGAVEAIARRLTAAQRPLILAGEGAVRSDAGPLLADIARQSNIPVVMDAQARGLVPEDDVLGFNWGFAQLALKHADAVLIVGARLSAPLGFGLPPMFAADTWFGRVDAVAEELDRPRPMHIALQSDPAAFLAALMTKNLGHRAGRAWLASILAGRRAAVDNVIASHPAPLHPLRIFRTVQGHFSGDTVFAVDGGYPVAWSNLALRPQRPRRFMDHYPLGQMGSSLTLALGAAAAMKEKAARGETHVPVVLLTGDGAAGYYITSLSEAVRAELSLLVIVINDGAWASEVHSQVRDKVGRAINTTLGRQDFSLIAQGLGGLGVRVETDAAFAAALHDLSSRSGVRLIDCIVQPDDALVIYDMPDLGMSYFHEMTATGRGALHT